MEMIAGIDAHKTDRESKNQLQSCSPWYVEFIEVARRPGVNDQVKTAVQRQDCEVLIARVVAVTTDNGLIPVAADWVALQQSCQTSP